VSDPTPAPANWENRNFARAEGVWYLRHSSVLSRWPVLAEPWAQRVEARRLSVESPDRGDKTFLNGGNR
jgi:hypothetical protein